MKRSQIVNKVATCLYNMHTSNAPGFADMIRDAAEVMKQLEEAGMLPPGRIIEYKDIRLKTRTKLSYTWEPEE